GPRPTLQSASTINSATGSLTLSGAISGSNSLTKKGTGTLTLSASNSYTGGTTIAAGTLVVTQDAALGPAAGSTLVASGATLALAGGFTYATVENLFLNGPGAGNAGALENLSGTNTSQSPKAIDVAMTEGPNKVPRRRWQPMSTMLSATASKKMS